MTHSVAGMSFSIPSRCDPPASNLFGSISPRLNFFERNNFRSTLSKPPQHSRASHSCSNLNKYHVVANHHQENLLFQNCYYECKKDRLPVKSVSVKAVGKCSWISHDTARMCSRWLKNKTKALSFSEDASANDIFELVTEAFNVAIEKAQELSKDLLEGEHISGSPWLDDEDVTLLAKRVSPYNRIQVIEVARQSQNSLAGARLLLLDTSGNIHSIYWPLKVWTESYYDTVACLPPLIPDGPVAILGLGGGTAARILHHVWPDVEVHGWELDPEVVQVAREFLDLRELEAPPALPLENSFEKSGGVTIRKQGQIQIAATGGPYRRYTGRWHKQSAPLLIQGVPDVAVGTLRVHIGDALGDETALSESFAGLFVDLFANGAVLPALQEAATWHALKGRMTPEGRILVNCGGKCVEGVGRDALDGDVVMWRTLDAMEEVFPGEVWCRRLEDVSGNVMALTGGDFDLTAWQNAVPAHLHEGLKEWQLFDKFRQQTSQATHSPY